MAETRSEPSVPPLVAFAAVLGQLAAGRPLPAKPVQNALAPATPEPSTHPDRQEPGETPEIAAEVSLTDPLAEADPDLPVLPLPIYAQPASALAESAALPAPAEASSGTDRPANAEHVAPNPVRSVSTISDLPGQTAKRAVAGPSPAPVASSEMAQHAARSVPANASPHVETPLPTDNLRLTAMPERLTRSEAPEIALARPLVPDGADLPDSDGPKATPIAAAGRPAPQARPAELPLSEPTAPPSQWATTRTQPRHQPLPMSETSQPPNTASATDAAPQSSAVQIGQQLEPVRPAVDRRTHVGATRMTAPTDLPAVQAPMQRSQPTQRPDAPLPAADGERNPSPRTAQAPQPVGQELPAPAAGQPSLAQASGTPAVIPAVASAPQVIMASQETIRRDTPQATVLTAAPPPSGFAVQTADAQQPLPPREPSGQPLASAPHPRLRAAVPGRPIAPRMQPRRSEPNPAAQPEYKPVEPGSAAPADSPERSAVLGQLPPAELRGVPGHTGHSVTPAFAPHHVARQLGTAISRVQDGSLRLRLSPEELGSFTMHLRHDGPVLHLTIQVDRPETLDLFQRNLSPLLDELSKLGFDRVDVDLGGQAREQTQRSAGQATPRLPAAGQAEESAPPAPPEPVASTTDGMDIRL